MGLGSSTDRVYITLSQFALPTFFNNHNIQIATVNNCNIDVYNCNRKVK